MGWIEDVMRLAQQPGSSVYAGGTSGIGSMGNPPTMMNNYGRGWDMLGNGGVGPSFGSTSPITASSDNPFGATGAYGGNVLPQPSDGDTRVYAGGTPNFNESTGRYTTPRTPTPYDKQPAFTPISQLLQGAPRQMPPMPQQPMPNVAQMLAQMGGKFPLMDPSQFMRNASQTPVRQPSERVAPAPVARTMPVRDTVAPVVNTIGDTIRNAFPSQPNTPATPAAPTTYSFGQPIPRGYAPGEPTPADEWWNPGY